MSPTDFILHLSNVFFRLHMSIMVVAMTAFGVVLNRILSKYGLDSMGTRYILVVFGSYLFFYLLVWMWIGLVLPEKRALRKLQKDSGDIAEATIEATIEPYIFTNSLNMNAHKDGSSSLWVENLGSSIEDATDSLNDIDDEFLPDGNIDSDLFGFILFFVFFTLLVGGAIYLIAIAPAILAESAIHYAVARGIVKRSDGSQGPLNQHGWALQLFRRTIAFFLILVVSFGLIGYTVSNHCPNAKHILDLIKPICKTQSGGY